MDVHLSLRKVIKSWLHSTFPLHCFTAENGDTCSADDTSYFDNTPLANSPFGLKFSRPITNKISKQTTANSRYPGNSCTRLRLNQEKIREQTSFSYNKLICLF